MSDLFDGVETPRSSGPEPATAAPTPSPDTWSTVASAKIALMITIGLFLAYPLRPLLGLPVGSPLELWAETLVLYMALLLAVEASGRLATRLP